MSGNSYGLNTRQRPEKNLRWLYLPFMVLLALGACAFATQHAAEFYGFHESLGQPFHIADIPFYAPWSIFFWQRNFPDEYGAMAHAVTLGQAIFLVPQFVILGFWFARRRMKGIEDLHGSSKWASEEDIREMGYFRGNGVYVGGWCKRLGVLEILTGIQRRFARELHYYLRHDGPEHILCFAPTRSGKGVGLILPTLLSWPHASLIFDIKGENWALTSGWRQSLGHKVLRFDPSDISGAGCCFNPLEEMRLGSMFAIQDVQNLAMMLVDPEGKGLGDHWSKAAFAFFSGIILHCCVMVPHREGRAATLNDLTIMLADESRTTEELLTEMLETNHQAILEALYPGSPGGLEAHVFIASSAREMMNKDEKEASGVLSTALVNMALYRDPIVAMNTSRCDFRIHDLMNHEVPLSLYLVVSPADIDRVKPLMRLILDMIIRRVCAKMEFADGASVASYKHRLLFMLDEFTSIGKLPIIEKAIAYIAGYGGKMYLIVQDITQLNGAYGKDNALMANCHVRIAYAPNTIETAKTLSDMTGKTTVVETKTSLSGSRLGSMKNASLSVSETARNLLTPDECMRLPGMQKNGKSIKPGHMLIFTAGQPAIYGEQILYFRDPVFSARAKISAPGSSARFPAGISDSLYFPRPADWYRPSASSPVSKTARPAHTPVSRAELSAANCNSDQSEKGNEYEHYFL